MAATMVLVNGRIHTMNPQQPTATAVAVQGGRILAVGADEAMRALLGAGGALVDLQGRGVTPGLMDAHVHFQWYSLNLQHIDLFEVPSLAEAQQRVRAYLAQRAGGAAGWLQGRGWSQDLWPDRRFPTAADLDAVAPDVPLFLRHKSGHAAWVNGRALALAGITRHTPDPPGGQIQRDAAGAPTGILFEDAMSLVRVHIPEPTAAEVVAAMRAAQARCWQAGLTGLHDFDGRASFQALQTLRQTGELGLRVVKNIPVYRLEHAVGVGLRTGFGDEWLRIGGVKLFADGALGPRTAAMLAPYEGEPDNTGIVVTDKEEMMEKVSLASTHGLSATIHAIGDRANHDVLDVYAAVRQEEAARGAAGPRLRHRIEHVQILHPADVPRLAQLGVIASMQPTHCVADMEMADRYWGARTRTSYAWRQLQETGAGLAFGPDPPIEDIAPLPGLIAAVTRRRADGYSGAAGWHPAQKLTMAEAVRAFTMGTAVAGTQESVLGSITPGKLADLTIFDGDI
ncbi:MAG: amidohydrolase, partial [Anaerolineales bacterium]|nr:amidohydrolase [Anaerolineales bacterium]